MKKFTLLLLIQYLIVVLILMFLYKGGYIFKPEIHHFVWDKTYLSDLGRTHYFSGVANSYWSLYTLTLGGVGIGTVLFFYFLSREFGSYKFYAIILFGLLSGVGYMGIALNPVDIRLAEHLFWGKIAFFSFYFALILTWVFGYKKLGFKQKFYLVILIVFLSIYLYLQFTLPKTTSEQILATKVIAQKIIVFAQLLLAILLLQTK